METTYKTCSKCKKELPEDNFSIRGNEGFRRTDCKNCVQKRTKQANRLKKAYGKPSKDYICPICNRQQHEFSRAFSLDHDHETGEFRGWLCHNCNTGLGLFKDNLDTLQKAINYLKKSNKRSLMSKIINYLR
tara:strand:+ start:192 stop:587 length:396 start_codon:yes stop_codon:yes gene_type:complete